MSKAERPLIIAHRGSAGESPENTLAAFRRALEQQCDAIELDIQLTQDDQIVVCHDDTLDRTTSGSGRIRKHTVEQIKQLDAGSWYGQTFAGEQVPLLEEVFALVPPDIMINVEIKQHCGHQIEDKLVALLRKTNRLDNVVISSFNFKCLLKVKELEPQLKIGLLYVANVVDHRALATAMPVSVYSLHPHYSMIDPEDIVDAQANGLRVFPYTINQREHLQMAIDAGVAGIITDYPAVLKELLDR